MSDAPVPPPPASPPSPRINWLRVLFVIGVCVLAASIMIFPPASFEEANPPALLALEILIVGPIGLLVWSLWRLRTKRDDATRRRFRWLWTGISILAVLVTGIVFFGLNVWQDEAAEDVRLVVCWLLAWTSVLTLFEWVRLSRREFWRALTRKAAFAAACLVTLVALPYGFENWTGKRAWEETRRTYEAKGETLDFRKFHPAPIPDSENVAAHPLFKFPFTDAYRRRKPESAWSAEEKSMDEYLRLLSLLPNHSTLHRLKPPGAQLPLGTNEMRFHDLAKWRDYFHTNSNFIGKSAGSSFATNIWPTRPASELSAGATNPAVDVLLALTKLDASFALVEEALQRPRCRFAVDYEQEDVWGILVPHLSHTYGIVRSYALRASARLALGEVNRAFQDVQTSVRLANLLEKEFFLIGLNVHIRALGSALGPAAEGTARHQWNDAQLTWFSSVAKQCDFLTGYATSMRAEAAGMASFWDWARRNRKHGAGMASGFGTEEMPYQHWFPWLPAGWFYRQQGAESSRILDANLRSVNPEQRRYYRPSPPARPIGFNRDSLIWTVMTPRWNAEYELRASTTWVSGQTAIDQFAIAIALERHWLRHRAYPERLDALVPAFLDRLPHDLFDGQPMRYRREGDGFVLWSIGFDGKDDNAGPLQYGPKGGSVGEETGDLVWRYPQAK